VSVSSGPAISPECCSGCNPTATRTPSTPFSPPGREQWIKLDRPLPVYLLYFTAWAQEDGTVRFHHDVYQRSEAVGVQAEEMVTPSGDSRTT
jgi:hypothetical protein